jgi:hypothetical protein
MRWIDRRIGAAITLSVLAPACGGSPSGPSVLPSAAAPNASDIASLEIVCPATLIVGQLGVCAAVAHVRSGATLVVTTSAAWSSSDAGIAAPLGIGGTFRAHGAGDVTIGAKYLGQAGSARIAIHAEDMLQAGSYFDEGPFRIGSTVTMGLEGVYGVASAESGQLNLVIIDQHAAVVAATSPQTVTRGGDAYLLQITFTVPSGTNQLCRVAVLKLVSSTLGVGPSFCTPINP